MFKEIFYCKQGNDYNFYPDTRKELEVSEGFVRFERF